VRVAVVDKTKGDQVPWTEDGIQRRQRVLFGGEAKATPSSPLRLSEAAEAWDRAKDGTSVAVLEAFIARYKDTFYADLARARIADLKKKEVVSSAPKTKQPAPMGGMLRCESLSERAVCEFDPSCSWADDEKQCQRKSGSLATAMLEAKPPPKAAPPCAGVETQVGNETRCLKPGDSFRECPECPEMVVIPAGSFVMGSPTDEVERRSNGAEGPQRRVAIGEPLSVGKFEVTFIEWDACVSGGGCKHKPEDRGWGRGRRPVIKVSWDDITKQFLPWLSRKSGKAYRLLTEAEWEYAARAGTTTPFSTGRTITTDQANFDGNYTYPYGGSSTGQYRQKTVEVGSFKPNAFGLHDVHGNVWEWVEDCWHDNYQGAPTDGSAWTPGDCSRRVLRGGSWGDFPGTLRSALRDGRTPVDRESYGGFRVARTLTP
jgi:formylglycine-generating enzyme required for sulfatase activity